MPSNHISRINVGSPPKPFNILFDTGSSSILLASTHCHKNNTCRNVPFYNEKSSKSFKPYGKNNTSLIINFPQAKVKGRIGLETFQLSKKIIVTNQIFSQVYSSSQNIFLKGHMSGILGLGLKTKGSIGPTLFESLAKQKVLKKNIIGFSYSKFKGEINFGYINDKNYKGTINKNKVISKTYWA